MMDTSKNQASKWGVGKLPQFPTAVSIDDMSSFMYKQLVWRALSSEPFDEISLCRLFSLKFQVFTSSIFSDSPLLCPVLSDCGWPWVHLFSSKFCLMIQIMLKLSQLCFFVQHRFRSVCSWYGWLFYMSLSMFIRRDWMLLPSYSLQNVVKLPAGKTSKKLEQSFIHDKLYSHCSHRSERHIVRIVDYLGCRFAHMPLLRIWRNA